MNMRMMTCPHCRQRLSGVRFGVQLGPIQLRIIDAITRAAPDGISRTDLVDLIYGDRPVVRQTISVHIRQINIALGARDEFQIISTRGHHARYRIEQTAREAAA
jgi:DNA-binding winged helix-turn-helix (wHTH) protein